MQSWFSLAFSFCAASMQSLLTRRHLRLGPESLVRLSLHTSFFFWFARNLFLLYGRTLCDVRTCWSHQFTRNAFKTFFISQSVFAPVPWLSHLYSPHKIYAALSVESASINNVRTANRTDGTTRPKLLILMSCDAVMVAVRSRAGRTRAHKKTHNLFCFMCYVESSVVNAESYNISMIAKPQKKVK